MPTELELAQSLKDNFYTPYPQRELLYDVREGIKVTYPHQIWEGQEDPFAATSLPQHWWDFIKEIDPIRQSRGTTYPVDILQSVHLLLTEHPRAQELELENFVIWVYN